MILFDRGTIKLQVSIISGRCIIGRMCDMVNRQMIFVRAFLEEEKWNQHYIFDHHVLQLN